MTEKSELFRLPSESLVRFYNRRLEAKGDYDRQWIETPGGALIIVRRHNQQSKRELYT